MVLLLMIGGTCGRDEWSQPGAKLAPAQPRETPCPASLWAASALHRALGSQPAPHADVMAPRPQRPLGLLRLPGEGSGERRRGQQCGWTADLGRKERERRRGREGHVVRNRKTQRGPQSKFWSKTEEEGTCLQIAADL